MSPQERARARELAGNRILWGGLLAACLVYAWLTGERVLFVAAAALFALPLASVLLTRYFLMRMTVSQHLPDTVLKGEQSHLVVRFHNHTVMPFGNVECVFHADEHALRMPARERLFVRPLRTTVHRLGFVARYRGQFLLGVRAFEVRDITGLFLLRKNLGRYEEVVSMPLVKEMSAFPLSMNALSEAQTRHDLRDEDYATISNIREYMPADSIKRVHWKLTAKKGEWLVKVFQSNAQSRMSLIIDSRRPDLPPALAYPLEDHMVETAVALARRALAMGIPVDFFATESMKSSAGAMWEFGAIYAAACGLRFERSQPLSPHSILSHLLNDASGMVNAVVIAPRLDGELCERLLGAVSNGHSVTALYFAADARDELSEKIFGLLQESGVSAYRLSGEHSFVN